MPLSTSTDLLDFGDCYSGLWVSRLLSLKNVEDSTLEVTLSALDVDVKFGLVSDENDPDNEEVLENPTFDSKEPHPVGNKPGADVLAVELSDDAGNSSKSTASGIKEFVESDSESTVEESKSSIKLRQKKAGVNSTLNIEELTLKPGSEKTITVSYRPKEKSAKETEDGSLVEHRFSLKLAYIKVEKYVSDLAGTSLPVKRTSRSKYVRGISRSCTSIMDIQPKKLDFEDVDIGMQREIPVLVSNYSDLPTQIELKYKSKVISCPKGPLTILPKSSIQVRISVFPNKVNPEYRKQIVVCNVNNPDNFHILEILSNHRDNNRVAFHSLFYKILTASGSNFLDLSTVVVNSPKISNFVIENISQADLVLELNTTQPEELFFLKINQNLPEDHPLKAPAADPLADGDRIVMNRSGVDLRESILETMDDQSRTFKKGPTQSSAQPNQSIQVDLPKASRHQGHSKSTTYLDLAQRDGADSPRRLPAEISRLPLPTIPSATWNPSPRQDTSFLRHQPISSIFAKMQDFMSQPLPSFPNIMAEEEYAKQVIQMRRDLESYVKNKVIIPCRTITVVPGDRFHVIVLFSARAHLLPQIQGIPRTLNAKILIKMLEFSKSPYKTIAMDADDVPVREIPVQSLACRSVLDLGQKNFNFGLIDKDESRTRMLMISNCSETPLVFMLRKSGSIASGDIHFEGSKYGVVRGFGKKIVNYTFRPSLPGTYHETVIVRNIHDPEDDQVIQVKALIRKPSTFMVDHIALDFGPCYINELCVRDRTITVSNMHRNPRVFEVRVEPGEINFGWCSGAIYFYVNSEGGEPGQSILTAEVEQQIEALEQKLKIARRKGHDDKVKKIEDKLERLRNGESAKPEVGQENDDLDDPAPSQTSPEPSLPVKVIPTFGEVGYVHKSAYAVQFTVPGSSRLSVSVWLKPIPTAGLLDCLRSGTIITTKEMVSGQLLVHEHRNRDACKRVLFQALVFYNRPQYSKMLSHFSHPSNIPAIKEPV
ncbi:hypothetical protein DSO57_1020571 [Entomophthora muscae]|uniref:Uncharacterized protein n=1 Tax=Entomophthora muscae TaxID=34485 RepID=A0ACC2U1Z1_9FUNG|nr:hypothetical protein DSO57_1020571 [Entomophthora muscae]